MTRIRPIRERRAALALSGIESPAVPAAARPGAQADPDGRIVVGIRRDT